MRSLDDGCGLDDGRGVCLGCDMRRVVVVVRVVVKEQPELLVGLSNETEDVVASNDWPIQFGLPL